MRGLLALALLMIPATAFAHDDDVRMLGHHWAVPEYVGEIHIQIAAMAAATILCAGVLLLFRSIKRSTSRG